MPSISPARRGALRISLAIVSVLLWAGHAQPAFAHEAASGWSYPALCCSGMDCYEISESEIQPAGAGWRVKRTGEVIYRPQLKDSPDGRFHRCSKNNGDPSASTICLFVPPFGF